MDNSRMNCKNYSGRRGCSAGRSAECSRSRTMMPDEQMIHWENLPLAMGYVPIQRFKDTFDLCKGYHMGTIFPELCKPFCGKGGGRRC